MTVPADAPQASLPVSDTAGAGTGVCLTRIVQTCGACPSQWEGTTDDGRWVYVRYRYGYLSIRLGGPAVMDAVMGPEIFGAPLGDELDGSLDYDELRAAVPDGLIEWPEQVKLKSELYWGLRDGLIEWPEQDELGRSRA